MRKIFVKLFLILTQVQEMLFSDISIFSFGGHFVKQS